MVGLIHEVAACHRALQEALEDCTRRWQIDATELRIVWLCGRRPDRGLSQTELATETAVSAAKISTTVERLRRRGILKSNRCAADRRRQLWQLDAGGRGLVEGVREALERLAVSCSSRLSEDERQTLTVLLDRLAQAAGRWHSAAESPSQDPVSAAGREANDERFYRRAC
jgi:DNA-binding MarR family transcriptional regulator